MTSFRFRRLADGLAVAENGVWVPGYYDNEDTARFATTRRHDVLTALSARICHFAHEDRAITMDDLLAANEKGEG